MAIYNILVRVDSRAALYAGIGITFCWVPSHCGIIGNEMCDRLAKSGALNSVYSIAVPHLLLSNREMVSFLDQFGRQKVKSTNFSSKKVYLVTF
jgi:hypothetical protein